MNINSSIIGQNAPTSVPAVYITLEQLQILEDYEQNLPRFLFRGFHHKSGGGNKRLNSKKAVIPHGFLDKHTPTSIADIPRLERMIYSHLKGHRNIKSCFSSWTAQFDVAFEYSEYLDTGRIAIIDTNFLEPHVKIYHVLALQDANLTTSDYYEEYLVYGPIQGRAYRCVKRTELERTGTSFLDPSGYPLSALPAENFTPQFASQIRKVGLLFRHPEDKGPDVILTFAAIMIGCMFEVESPTDVAIATRFILYYFTPEIKALKLPAGTPVFGNLGLVNPMVYTLQQPELKYAVKVLEAIEIYVRHYES